MKQKLRPHRLLLCLLCLLAATTKLAAQSSNDFNCLLDTSVHGLSLAPDCYFAPYGRKYTPKGRLHVLVVLVRYNDTIPLAGNPLWLGDGTLPAIFRPDPNVPANLGLQSAIFNELPSTVSANQTLHNLSEYFYTFSNPSDPFIVTGYVYPRMIEVPPFWDINPGDSNDVTKSHAAALDSIALQNPNFDWSKFDLRTRQVGAFRADNTTEGPDGKLDYVVFMHRNPGGSGASVTYLPSSVYTIPGTQYSAPIGHTFLAGTPVSFAQMAKDFLHEYSHINMALTHYSGANQTHGPTFHVQNFYGMMGGGGMGFYTPTAWESWFNGWLPNFTEVHPANAAQGPFELKDFATTHSGMRIEIPFSHNASNMPQYLWVENRKKISRWDDKKLYNFPGINDVMQTGLYAYIVKNEGSDLFQPCLHYQIGANIIKPISADGAYDWDYDGTAQGLFREIHIARRLEANPLAGGTYRQSYARDTDSNMVLNVSTFTGNGNSAPYEYTFHEGQRFPNPIGVVEHWKHAGNDDEAFQIGGEMSLSGAMPIMNYANYNDNHMPDKIYDVGLPAETMEPTYLNGLSVKYVGDNAAGNALVQVVYNDYEVRTDKRWCGNLILPDFEPNSATEYLNIAMGVELRIDQSKTLQRETVHPLTGTWVNPTTFTIQNGGAMHLDPYAQVIVENNSALILEAGANLEVHNGANVIVRTNGILQLKGGSKIYVHDGGSIVIERGATITYDNGADITLNGFNSVLEIHGSLVIGANANFTFHNGSSPNAGFIRFDLPTIGNYGPNITCGANSRITLSGAGTSDLVMEVLDYTTVHPNALLDKLTIQNGLVKMGKTASINTGDVDFKLFRLAVTAFQPTMRHSGIFVNGQTNHVIDHVEISHGNRAITAHQFYNGGAMLRVSNSNFHDCEQAVVAYKKGVSFANCDFHHNTYGYIHYYPTFNSRAFSSHFDNNSLRGIHVFAAGGRLLMNHSFANNNGREGIFYKGNSSLALTCSNVSYNGQVGIYASHGTYLTLDNSVNTNGAQSIIYKNPTSISLNWARELYLNKGRNEIMSLVHSSRNDIKGTMMKSCPSPNSALSFAASKNHWNLRATPCLNDVASNLSDYAVTGYANCGISFQDQTPACAPVNCDESGGGGGGGGIASPLESCNECTHIHTTSFPNERLDKALQTAIENMEILDSTANDLIALEMLSQILTYDYATISQDERWLLDLAYTNMWQTYAHACEAGHIDIAESANLPLPNTVTSKVLLAIAAMKGRATNAMQQQSYDLDIAIAYTYVNRNTRAIALLEASLPDLDPELRDYASVMLCQLKAEENVVKGKLKVWEFEAAIAACNPAMKIADIVNPWRPLPDKTMDLTTKIYPNPSHGSFKLLIVNASPGKGVATLFDSYGKGIMDRSIMIANGDAESTLEFNASALAAGIYAYRFIDAAGHCATGELIVAK